MHRSAVHLERLGAPLFALLPSVWLHSTLAIRRALAASPHSTLSLFDSVHSTASDAFVALKVRNSTGAAVRKRYQTQRVHDR
jgi:hypothetical protein